MIKKSRSGPVFGRPVNFEDKFPMIRELEIKLHHSWPKKDEFYGTLTGLPGREIACSNEQCSGRFYIWPVIDEVIEGKEIYRKGGMLCPGVEKSMGGRKCANVLNYEIHALYK